MQGQPQRHRIASVLLFNQCRTYTRPQCDFLRSLIDIRRGDVELFACRHILTPLVASHQVLKICQGGNSGAVGSRRGLEDSHGAVVRLQVLRRDRRHLFRLQRLHPIAMDEVQPPVSLGGPVAQRDRQPAAVGRRQFPTLQHHRANPLDFLGGHAFLRSLGDRVEHRLPEFFRLGVGGCLGEDQHHPGVVQREGCPADGSGLLGLDQRFVESTRNVGGQDSLKNLNGGEFGMAACGNVIGQSHDRDRPDAPEPNQSLAILGGLFRVSRNQRCLGFGERPEVLLHQVQGLFGLEFARHNQEAVVGPVEPPVEVLEILDRHPLDVGAIANR